MAAKDTVTIFYASDIHGSERCWRKFLNAGPFFKADILILGGDVTGKGIVPIVEDASRTWRSSFLGRELHLVEEAEVDGLESDIRHSGMYPYRCSREQLAALQESEDLQDETLEQLAVETFDRWLGIAEEKLAKNPIPCYVMPGNDDTYALDSVFRGHEFVENCDQRVVTLGDEHEMISVGCSNRTPWNSPREVSEAELGKIIDELAAQVHALDRAIFNLHVPPYNSGLDVAPELDADLKPVRVAGQLMTKPVGSTAVRAVIERDQPLVGLHGHVHESKGKRTIGRTLCLNPGSTYSAGQLDGVLLVLDRKGIKTTQFVVG